MKLEGVNRRFGDRDVLKDVNLNFDKNGMVFILGASGSGKSTLLNVLGLLDDGYDGKIYYGEKSVSDEAQKTNIRRKHIAFIFQEYNLINSLTVKENVQTAVDISEGVLDEEVYSNIISMFKLNNLENRDVATLSGGEKQRVAIARALVRNNEIIFADEPTGNLDEENSDIIFNALKEVAKNHLVVIVSHNKEAAEKFADRIITIRDGRIFDDSDRGYSENSTLELTEQREKNPKSKKWIKRISLRSFQKRKKKLIPSIIAIFISLACISTVCGILSSTMSLINNTNASMIDSDMVSINREDDFYGESIPEELIKKLNDTGNIKKIVKKSERYLTIESNEREGYISAVDTKAILLDDFFKERIKPQMGEMISKDREILINTDMAEEYFESAENAIGKTIKFEGSKIEAKIVGIYDNLVSTKIPYVVITEKLQREMSRESLDSYVVLMDSQETMMLNSVLNDIDKNSQPKMICGQLNKNKNEALLSVKSINKYLESILREDLYISNEEASSGKIPQEVQNLIIGSEYILGSSNAKVSKIKITGICESKDLEATQAATLYVNSEDKDQWIEDIVQEIDVYLNDYSSAKIDEIKAIANEDDYKVVYLAENIKRGFSQIFSFIGIAISIVALIIIIISCILVSHSTKSNIFDRVYEVGVLKSLGADKKSIFKMFSIENLIIGLISSLATILLIIILNIAGLSSWLIIQGMPCYSFSWWHIIVILFVGLFITMISGLGKMNKASKMSVTDAIRTKNN